MTHAPPLKNGSDSAERRRHARPCTDRPSPMRISDLEAERDALREMMKQAEATERFLR